MAALLAEEEAEAVSVYELGRRLDRRAYLPAAASSRDGLLPLAARMGEPPARRGRRAASAMHARELVRASVRHDADRKSAGNHPPHHRGRVVHYRDCYLGTESGPLGGQL